ncbi:hypothetical protein [Sphingomonas sp.]|uniref:hypothetical protein n=1 Tax=Sphingomonas sp. TaxID=28214 RepID=UPI000DB25D15|nr:hypothetical protein [Sphingomonas sp.]PZU06636.1 MAG: hypothetical protein DI605_18470 [Sphingomonas sp.]
MNAADHGFGARAVALVIGIGCAAFIAMLVLGAYAPDWGTRNNGRANALSGSAVGFSGIVRLINESGGRATIIRDERTFDTEDLVILAPESATTSIDAAIRPRRAKPTLIVLPKWTTTPDRDRPGWVRRIQFYDRDNPQGVMAPGTKLHVALRRSGGRPLINDRDLPATIRFTAPRPVQVITGSEITTGEENGRKVEYGHLRPLIHDGHGGIVLAQLDNRSLYILADPDLMSNRGMASLSQAESTIALLDWLNSNGAEAIYFDVTLNGFGREMGLLKLALSPPFLAFSIGLLIVALLAGFHGLGRFGPALARPRAIGFGKAALIENATSLVRRARREADFGSGYAALVRERAMAAYGVPAGLSTDAIDAYLDGLGRGERFSELVRRAEAAATATELIHAADMLREWERNPG